MTNPEPQTESADIVVSDMVRHAARSLTYVPGERPETTLVNTLVAALRTHPQVNDVGTEGSHTLTNWTRKPGRIDVHARLNGKPAPTLIAEAKVGKPDESGWDAIKLADLLHRERPNAVAYLLSDRTWPTHAPLAPIFAATEELTIQVTDLIARWPAAWLGVLIGGRGIRPTTSVATLVFTPVAKAPVAHHAGHELVALRIAPGARTSQLAYDADGWPEGYEPPAGMRARGREADEKLKAGSAAAPADSYDPCHQYPWFKRWSQSRLDEIAPGLDDDAYRCLRRRLMRERNWTEEELRERVDPLRARG